MHFFLVRVAAFTVSLQSNRNAKAVPIPTTSKLWSSINTLSLVILASCWDCSPRNSPHSSLAFLSGYHGYCFPWSPPFLILCFLAMPSCLVWVSGTTGALYWAKPELCYTMLIRTTDSLPSWLLVRFCTFSSFHCRPFSMSPEAASGTRVPIHICARPLAFLSRHSLSFISLFC